MLRLKFNSFARLFLKLSVYCFTMLLAMGAKAGDESGLLNKSIQISNVELSAVTPVSTTAAIYLKLTNTGNEALVLEEVETSVAHHAMIHLSKVEDGVAKMSHQEQLIVKSKETVEFERGGLHIMLMGINKELINKEFTVVLKFTDGTSNHFKVNQGK